jgi:hypothetical protein
MDQFEAVLKGLLTKDENVKWAGKPDPYKVLDEDNKKSTMTCWIISIAIAAALSGIYTIFALSGSSTTFQPIIYIFTIGFPLIAFIDPIRDRKQIISQVLAVTDQKVIVAGKNTGGSDNKQPALKLQDIDIVRVEQIESGFSRIRFGSVTFGAQGYKLRRITTGGRRSEGDKVIGLVFYRIDNSDCEKICSILNEKGIRLEKST